MEARKQTDVTSNFYLLFSFRVSIRVAALDILRRLLVGSYMADELSNWKTTILDVIEKALRKTDEELVRAAVLAALVSLQLGNAFFQDKRKKKSKNWKFLPSEVIIGAIVCLLFELFFSVSCI